MGFLFFFKGLLEEFECHQIVDFLKWFIAFHRFLVSSNQDMGFAVLDEVLRSLTSS